MLSIEECRKYLEGAELSEEQILALRDAFYDSTQLAFEVYWHRRNSGSKNPVRLLPDSRVEDTT